MSTENLTLEVLTMGKVMLQKTCNSVTLPAILGEMQVHPGHAAFISSLGFGILTCHSGNETTRFAIHQGYVEISKNRVTVLADLAEAEDEVNVENAKSEGEKAQARLDELIKKTPSERDNLDREFKECRIELNRSVTRLSLHNQATPVCPGDFE